MIVCPPYEELPEWNRLPSEDPRRAHAMECPRCRSWWLEFRDFEQAESKLEPREVDAAVDRLVLPRRKAPVHRPRRWWIAACIPLVAGGLWWASGVQRPTTPQWRGERSTAAAAPFELVRGGDTVRFESIAPGVSEIRFLWVGENLDALQTVRWTRPAASTSSVAEFDDLPRPPAAVFWQVEWTLEDGSRSSGELVPLASAGQR